MDEELRRLMEQARAAELLRSLEPQSGSPLPAEPPLVPSGPIGGAPVPMPEGWYVPPPAASSSDPGRGVLDALYDNVIGADDGVDSYGEQSGRGLNTGAARGVAGLASLPQMGMRGAGWLAEQAGNAVGLEGARLGQGLMGAFPLSGDPTPLELGEQHFPGTFGRAPESRLEGYAQTVGEFLPAALAGPGGAARNLLQYGVAPGLASEALGQATEGTSAEPWARLGGALVGAPVAGAFENLGRRAITPHPTLDPAREALTQTLRDAGVDVSAGQRTGSASLRSMEGSTGAGQRAAHHQTEQLTGRVMENIGSSEARATPSALSADRQRISDVFEDVTRGVNVQPTDQHVQQLQSIYDAYSQATAGSQQIPILRNVLVEMQSAVARGVDIPASTLQDWRSILSGVTSRGGEASHAAGQALDVIQGAVEDALRAAGRAGDVERWAAARQQWRDLLAVQRAATRSTEAAQVGLVEPNALYSAMIEQGHPAMALGQRGEMGELARAAQGVMSPIPESSGMERIFLRAPVSGHVGPSVIGAGLGYAIGDTIGGALGGAAGAALSPVLRRLAMTGPGQTYLGNQVLAGPPARTVPGWSPLVSALAQHDRRTQDGD